MYNYFGYYQNPNQFHFAYFINKFNTTLGGLLKPFGPMAAGYKWNYAKNESLYYFQQHFKKFYHNQVRTVFQETSNGRGIESCVSESLKKTSIKFEVDLVEQEKRPQIF